jgi:hypothetical protein
VSEGRELWDAVIVGEVERDCLRRSISDGAAGSRQGTGPSIRPLHKDPARAEMIIAVGQGATAGQAIDRDLFDESLQCHRLPRIGTSEAWVAGASSEMEGRR